MAKKNIQVGDITRYFDDDVWVVLREYKTGKKIWSGKAIEANFANKVKDYEFTSRKTHIFI